MNGYKEFLDDVKIEFHNLIENFKPHLEYFNDDKNIYAVKLIFKNCVILVDLDHWDLQAKFLNPNSINQEYYHIYDVLELLNPKLNPKLNFLELPKDGREKVRVALSFLSTQLEKYLLDVVKGDFSWVSCYHKKKAEEAEVMKALWSLDYNDPIYKKFKTGDISWKEDIKKINK